VGVWGTGVFSDDTAADVRGEYRAHIEDGVDGRDATDKVLEVFRESLDDRDDAPSVWLGLAATQAQLGRLEARVRDRALQIIADGTDLRRFDEQPRLRAKRAQVLGKLKERLLGAQRPAVRLRKPKAIECQWAPGDIVGFRGTERTWLLYVHGVVKDVNEMPLVSVLNLPFEDVQTASRDTSYLATTHRLSRYKDCFYLFLTQRQYKSDTFIRTGIRITPRMEFREKPETLVTYVGLKGLDAFLSRCLAGRPQLI
jgi:hypothetical protein